MSGRSLDVPRGTERVARRLVEMLQAPPADTPRVLPLAPAQAPRRAIAVDGSSIVVAGTGDRMIAAYRAGSVGLEAGKARPARVPAPEVVLLSDDDAGAILAARLDRAGLAPEILGPIDAKGALDALRTLDEMDAAREAVEELGERDLLLLDGALASRGAAPLLDKLLARAAERRVDVVGVCKSTSMSIGGAPALVACQLAARGHATWMAPLPLQPHVRGLSFAARLSSAEPRAFRFDVASVRDPRDVLAALAGLCGHPAYPGYPSPLAMAHNAVLLNDEAKRSLRARVQEAVLKAGVDADAWDAAFVDYHDVLELGA